MGARLACGRPPALPELLSSPSAVGWGGGRGGGGGPGKPRVPTGGTGVELIIGRGRVQGRSWALGNSPPPTSSVLPAREGLPGENPQNVQGSTTQSSALQTPTTFWGGGGPNVPLSVLGYALLVSITLERYHVSALTHPDASVYH